MKRKKQTKKLLLIILLLASIAVVATLIINGGIKTSISKQSLEQKELLAGEESSEPQVYVASNLHEGTNTLEYIKANTEYLQSLVDKASNQGGGTVKIPAGTYYFAPAERNNGEAQDYVIKCKENVLIKGNGSDGSNATTLKPYGTTNYGLNMFYFNDYLDNNVFNYLLNADFEDFIIDGSEARGKSYNSSGKGFMLCPIVNCDWNRVVVKNTDGSGFGIVSPVNCTINDCKAIGCGKTATTSDGGACGFGIGVGYDSEESIHITNCHAENNKKYGFSFEHQARYAEEGKEDPHFTANSFVGFVVSNCTAKNNLYDFGAEKVTNLTYENCTSQTTNMEGNLAFHFEEETYNLSSTDVKIVNCSVAQDFTDITENEKKWYDVKAFEWVKNNAISLGTNPYTHTFEASESCTRAKAIIMLYRMEQMKCSNFKSLETFSIDKRFDDVSESDGILVKAVAWAVDNGIIKDADWQENEKFHPDEAVDRRSFLLMLYRLAGTPGYNGEDKAYDYDASDYVITDAEEFDNLAKEDQAAVLWALKVEILKGTEVFTGEYSEGIPYITVNPGISCTRGMVTAFMYRFSQIRPKSTISYNLFGGDTRFRHRTYR